MKKALLVLALPVLIMAMTSCTYGEDTVGDGGTAVSTPTTLQEESPASWGPLSDLPENYCDMQAAIDGVFISWLQGTTNQELVDQFYEDVAADKPAFMRTCHFTIEGDAIITDYFFDGTYSQ